MMRQMQGGETHFVLVPNWKRWFTISAVLFVV